MLCSIGFPPLFEARFLERPGQFLVRVRRETEEPLLAHLPDPGRLKELLVQGRRIWIRKALGAGRKTKWTAVLIETADGKGRVSLDTTLPNRLVRRGLETGAMEEFRGWTLERAEFPLGRSRVDFLLKRDARRMLLEVKSVTLVRDGVALFPDAVSARASRHLGELAREAESGNYGAAVLFLVQREDAARVEAARDIDPAFASALEEARAAGVRLHARKCRVTLEGVTLGEPLPAPGSSVPGRES